MQSSYFFLFVLFFLPLNKKSYSSSRFPILDEAGPPLLAGRDYLKSVCVICRYIQFKKKCYYGPDSAPVCWAVNASWPQEERGSLLNSAEGEEPLRVQYLPLGVASGSL